MITEEEMKELETIYRNNGTVGKESVLALIAELRRLYVAYAETRRRIKATENENAWRYDDILVEEFEPEKAGMA